MVKRHNIGKKTFVKQNKDFGCYNCRKAVFVYPEQYYCTYNNKDRQPIKLSEYCSNHIHFRKS